MEEKVTPPAETSGTLDKVFLEASQVILDSREAAASETSWGRTVLPTMKQAFWRGASWGAN